MTEGTTIATSSNDIANTRDCGPVCPMLKQFPKRMTGGKIRGFSSNGMHHTSIRFKWMLTFAMLVGFILHHLSMLKKCLLKQALETGKKIGEKLQKHAQSEFYKHSIALWGAY